MEKTMSKKRNIFTYIVDFFRSIGEYAKILVATEKDDWKEGLDAIKPETLSAEDAKILETLNESQNDLKRFEVDHAKLIDAIDYPSRGNEFKSGVKTEEQENVLGEEKQAQRTAQSKELDL